MKPESTLPKSGFFIHLAVLADVLALVFVLTLMGSGIYSKYGVGVQMPPSQYLMNVRGEHYLVSVTAGESPVYYLNNKRLEDGLTSLEKELDKIVDRVGQSQAGLVTIVLFMDQAVSRSVEQQLFNTVLSRGLMCAVAAEPED